MESVSQVCSFPPSPKDLANLQQVFSAPRYCDSTENKGAYINIGSDYQLDFHKFDAVPHPDIKPMAYQSGSLMSAT